MAALLVALHARLLAAALTPLGLASLVGLALGGAFVVYGIDRVRGCERDRGDWPERSAFVARHVTALRGAIVAAATLAATCAALQPPAVWVVCAGAGGLGLAHRRLKSRHGFKITYLTLAWCAVVVGLPLARGGGAAGPERVAWVAVITALTLVANLVASNASGAARRRLQLARAAAIVATGLALVATDDVRALAFVAAAQALALWPAHPSERARLWGVDGSLAAGAAIALLVLEA